MWNDLYCINTFHFSAPIIYLFVIPQLLDVLQLYTVPRVCVGQSKNKTKAHTWRHDANTYY